MKITAIKASVCNAEVRNRAFVLVEMISRNINAAECDGVILFYTLISVSAVQVPLKGCKHDMRSCSSVHAPDHCGDLSRSSGIFRTRTANASRSLSVLKKRVAARSGLMTG